MTTVTVHAIASGREPPRIQAVRTLAVSMGRDKSKYVLITGEGRIERRCSKCERPHSATALTNDRAAAAVEALDFCAFGSDHKAKHTVCKAVNPHKTTYLGF